MDEKLKALAVLKVTVKNLEDDVKWFERTNEVTADECRVLDDCVKKIREVLNGHEEKNKVMENMLDVCGIAYDVKFIEPNSCTDSFMGRTDTQKAIITINKNMPDDMQNQVLIHEWIHAVLGNYCIEDNSEFLVQTIASELYRTGFRVKLWNKN